MKPKQKSFLQNLDLVTTILPFGCIALLCCLFMLFPEGSANILASIRFFLGDELGSYYLLMGLGAVICSLYMAFSRFGSIKLGDMEKPQYTAFQWGSMMFTSGLAADILFILSVNGCFMQMNLILPKWGLSRTGLLYIHCSTGVLFPGAFTLSWQFLWLHDPRTQKK